MGAVPVLNVYYYFQRACQRDVAPLEGICGDKIHDSDGNSAVFWVESASGSVRNLQYRCTTCCTLVAFCEHLSEILKGWDLESALHYTAGELLALHPEVPSSRHDRAFLAIRALRSALDRNITLHGELI